MAAALGRLRQSSRSVLFVVVFTVLVGDVIALASIEESTALPPLPPDAMPLQSDLSSSSSTTTTHAPPTTLPNRVATTTSTVAPSLPPPSTLPDGYRFDVSVTPTCVHVGEEFTVALHLVYDAGYAFMVLYSDGQNHKHAKAGKAYENGGTVTYTWRAPPVVGQASVTAQAYEPKNNTKGTTVVSFRVVEVGATC